MEYSQEFRQIFIFRKSYVESIHRKVALDSSHYIRAFSLVIYINPNNFFNVLGWKLQHISLFCNPVIFPSCNICQLRRWQGNGFGFLFLLLAIFPLVKTRSQATTTLTLEITKGRNPAEIPEEQYGLMANPTQIEEKCPTYVYLIWTNFKFLFVRVLIYILGVIGLCHVTKIVSYFVSLNFSTTWSACVRGSGTLVTIKSIFAVYIRSLRLPCCVKYL